MRHNPFKTTGALNGLVFALCAFFISFLVSQESFGAGLVNVLNFGATGNGRIFSDTVTISGTTLTTSASEFSSSDVGKSILIQNAGTPPSGGPLTAVEVATAGSGYTAVPSCTITSTPVPPTTVSGSGATCVALMKLVSVTLVSGGSGCTNATNQLFTVTTSSAGGTPPTIIGNVTSGSLSGSISVSSSGVLTSLPTTLTAVPVYGGGCSTPPSVNLTFGVGAIQITAWGSNYFGPNASTGSNLTTLSGGSPTTAATLGQTFASLVIQPFLTTINSVSSATSITLNAAPTSVTSASLQIMVATNDGPAIQSAINSALSTRAALYIPSGFYWIAPSSCGSTGSFCYLDPGSGPLTVEGDGRSASILMWDSTSSGYPMWKNATGSATNLKSAIQFKDIQFRGALDFGDINPSGPVAISLNNYQSLEENDIMFNQIPGFGNADESIGIVLFTNNICETVVEDCARFVSSFNGVIEGNYFHHSNDDSVALHQASSIQAAGTIREGWVVANNVFEDTTCIHILQPRNMVIANNVLRRCKVEAINMDYSNLEGVNQGYNFTIANNIVTDFLTRAPFTSGDAGAPIAWTLPTPTTSSTDSTTLPMGNQQYSGYIPRFWDYRDNNYTNSAAIPPPIGINIHDNSYSRTLPAVFHYSDWGYGKVLTVAGWVDPPVTDASLRPAVGIFGNTPSLSTKIHDNQIKDVFTGIAINAPTTYPAISILDVSSNLLFDFTYYGISVGAGSMVRIANNDIDGDPYLWSPYRGSTSGSWKNGSTASTCIHSGTSATSPIPILSGNVCRDVYQVIDSGTYMGNANLALGQATSMTGWNATNLGIGVPPPIGGAWNWASINSDPTTAPTSYKALTVTHEFEAASLPTSGSFVAGEFLPVTGTGAAACSCRGWERLTTGSGNILGTDWKVVPIQ